MHVQQVERRSAPGAEQQTNRRVWQRGWFKATLGIVSLGAVGLFIAAEYLIHHAEPMIRKRVIESLSAEFNSSVELDRLDISLLNGIQVSGDGLRIPFGGGPTGTESAQPVKPLIAVEHFSFRTTFRGLIHQPTHIATVRVQGLELHVPPAQERGAILGANQGRMPADPNHPRTRPKLVFTVGEIRCTDVRLVIETNKPGKEPLEFVIQDVDLKHVGAKQALVYQAQLVNPKPRGLIRAQGDFGPWNSDDPRGTPIDGNFTFSNADMNTIKGLGGMLHGQGHYDGVLDHVVVDGTADVPDFSLDTANHPMSLRTRYHAFVDGTTGDTFLDPVQAVLGRSTFLAKGKVVKLDHEGHDIDLAVSMADGRIEDILQLSMKTQPPVMRGAMRMDARLHIPPGQERVPLKMAIAGKVEIQGVAFSNPQFQDRVDGLSMRAQGKPKEVKEASSDREAEVRSSMAVEFSLNHGLLTARSVRYQIPGAKVLLDGIYSMDGKEFEFKGHVQTEAEASQMVTGWKSWLLKPVDPFLKKNGAGLELPIQVSGTYGDVHMGLALHGVDETPAQMQQDMRAKQKSDSQSAAAKRASEKAAREDEMAARTKDLNEAERLHNQAVADRKEAQRHLEAAGQSPQ